MKNNVTKFDLDAAFKALDEIEIPKVPGLKANRPNINESVRRVDRLSMLLEDYYDINDSEDLADAKETRAEDIAQAKLDRIERIVDLDADTPEDILPSYVGKQIIQCPNCLNLFYKDPADVEPSEDNPDVVNVGEACQHCGNDLGYTLIGKVAADEPEAEVATEEAPVEDTTEMATEETAEIPSDETDTEAPGEGMEEINLDEIPEATEESLNNGVSETLNEEVDKELDKKLEEHNDYIKYLQGRIEEEETALKNAENEFVKQSIQRCIDALNADLDAAIPSEVKEVTNVEEDAIAVIEDETATNDDTDNVDAEVEDENIEEVAESLHEDVKSDLLAFANSLDDVHEDLDLTEASVDDVSNAEFEKMLKSPAYYESLDNSIDEDEDAFDNLNDDDFDEITDESLNAHISNLLTEVYSNVKDFTATNCEYINNDKLIVEGIIKFNSGKTKTTAFEFAHKHNKFVGLNESLGKDSKFILNYSIQNKKLIVENIAYKIQDDKNKISGNTK